MKLIKKVKKILLMILLAACGMAVSVITDSLTVAAIFAFGLVYINTL